MSRCGLGPGKYAARSQPQWIGFSRIAEADDNKQFLPQPGSTASPFQITGIEGEQSATLCYYCGCAPPRIRNLCAGA